MNTYEVIYIFGFDHDDWDKFTVTARDEAEAKKKAMDKVPQGFQVKKIKLIQTHNTMEQIKIQSVTPQGTFEHNGKTFHKFDVILDNGMVGEVNAMTPDKWKVGDEVVVKDHQQTKWGPRLKLDKPGFTPGGSKPQDPDATKGIIASWAVGVAMQVVGDPTQNHYEEAVLLASRIALRCRGIIKDEVNP